MKLSDREFAFALEQVVGQLRIGGQRSRGTRDGVEVAAFERQRIGEELSGDVVALPVLDSVRPPPGATAEG